MINQVGDNVKEEIEEYFKTHPGCENKNRLALAIQFLIWKKFKVTQRRVKNERKPKRDIR